METHILQKRKLTMAKTMTFDEYEDMLEQVNAFKMKVMKAICGILDINVKDIEKSTFSFTRTTDVDINYFMEYKFDGSVPISRRIDTKLVEMAMEGNVYMAREQYIELYCQKE